MHGDEQDVESVHSRKTFIDIMGTETATLYIATASYSTSS